MSRCNDSASGVGNYNSAPLPLSLTSRTGCVPRSTKVGQGGGLLMEGAGGACCGRTGMQLCHAEWPSRAAPVAVAGSAAVSALAQEEKSARAQHPDDCV